MVGYADSLKNVIMRKPRLMIHRIELKSYILDRCNSKNISNILVKFKYIIFKGIDYQNMQKKNSKLHPLNILNYVKYSKRKFIICSKYKIINIFNVWPRQQIYIKTLRQ